MHREQAVDAEEDRPPVEDVRRLVETTPDAIPVPILVDVATRSVDLDAETARRVILRARENTPDRE